MRKQVALLVLLTTLSASTLLSQQQDMPVVNVSSNPTGCTVILSGDMTVAGVTPTTFSQRLQGFYRITAQLDGYETYRSSVVLPGRGATDISIALSAKTRVKAGARSLVLPGWGQMYSGSRTRGVLLTTAALAAAVTAGILHLDYDDKRDHFWELERRFKQTREVAERELMLEELYQAQKEANDAEDARNLGVMILAGVWAYNVVDAVLFFPDFGIQISGRDLTFVPQTTGDGIKIVGVLSF